MSRETNGKWPFTLNYCVIGNVVSLQLYTDCSWSLIHINVWHFLVWVYRPFEPPATSVSCSLSESQSKRIWCGRTKRVHHRLFPIGCNACTLFVQYPGSDNPHKSELYWVDKPFSEVITSHRFPRSNCEFIYWTIVYVPPLTRYHLIIFLMHRNLNITKLWSHQQGHIYW